MVTSPAKRSLRGSIVRWSSYSSGRGFDGSRIMGPIVAGDHAEQVTGSRPPHRQFRYDLGRPDLKMGKDAGSANLDP